MALVVADRVQETTTTTGTGTYTLAGAKDGFQSFAAVGDGNTTYYACTDGTDYEVGIGTYTASGTTLARTTIIESSNDSPSANAAVDWGSGSKDIFVTLPASKATVLDASGNGTFTGDVTFTGDSYNAFWDKSENHLHFNDRATLSFGGNSTTPDMWIEHNNALNLNRIRGSDITIQDYDGHNIAKFQEDAGAILYFNGSQIAEVLTGGFDVTGEVNADDYVVDLNGVVRFKDTSSVEQAKIGLHSQMRLYMGSTGTSSNAYMRFDGEGSTPIIEPAAAAGAQSTTETIDFGASDNRWKDIYGKNLNVSTNITVGGTVDGVDIATNIPSSLGTAGQVLTVNAGATAGEWADAAGGADLYTANPSSATDPSATGANAIAIGSNAGSTGTNGIAIGTGADVLNSRSDAIAIGTNAGANGNDSIAIGEDALTSSGTTAAISIGRSSDARGAYSIAIGYTADAGTSSTRSTSIGYGAKSSGDDAVALGYSYVDEAGGFAAVVGNNTSTYGAQGANGVAIGLQAKTLGAQGLALGAYSQAAQTEAVALGGGYAQGVKSISIGSSSHATSTYGCAVGYDTTAVGSALALGTTANAQQGYSVAIHRGKSEVQGKIAFSGIFFGAIGDAQGGSFVLVADTTDATATVLTGNNGTASSTNQIVAASDTCIMFSGTVVAMQNGAQDQGGWEIKGLLKNDGGTTTLVSSNIQTFSDGNSWTVALSADNTNNALAITCTGEASHNIRWVANISTSEVTYA